MMASSSSSSSPSAAAKSSLFSVAGKNVLVTGGSRGIGFMIASGFFKAGANVLLTSRDEKACRDAAERLIEEGDGTGTRSAGPHNNNNNKCHYVASNVSSREGCELLAARAAKVFDNRLDVRICICIG